jgi:SAM-dependent methyltransferase
MPFHQLSFQELVSCPETGTKLQELEPWLFSNEPGDRLYPKLVHTYVLHPDIDQFLRSEILSISRVLAEFGEDEEIRHWFFSRYGFFNQSDPLPQDTEIKGEHYPGFWESLDLPNFVKELELISAEEVILDVIGDHHPQIGLDLGCGQGAMMQRMAERCGQVLGLEKNYFLAATANRLLPADNIQVTYFDPRKGHISRRLEKEPRKNAYAICGDLTAPPFNEPLFDWVHCGHVLDLVDYPEEVLVQIKGYLKPGGTLSIASPWDFETEGHFTALLEMLDQDFQTIHQSDGLPYLRFNHKRRYVLHEDWVWVGKLK